MLWLGIPLALLLAAPHLVALDAVRARVEGELRDQLGVPCTIGRMGFSWFSGFAVRDLEVANPDGFPSDRPALRLRRAACDLGLWSLLGGRFELVGDVDGLELFVEQRADGRTNLQELAARGRTSSPTDTSSSPGSGGGDTGIGGDDARSLLDRVRLDLQLRESQVEVRRDGQPLEALRGLRCSLRKEFAARVASIDFDAKLAPLVPGGPDGRLTVQMEVDLVDAHIDGMLSAAGVALERYAPLADSLVPGQLTQLQGLTNGTLRVHGSRRELTIDGELTVTAPRFAGPALRGMDVRGERWSFAPNVTVRQGDDGAADVVDVARCTFDLGWLKVRGMPTGAGATGAGNARFTAELDLATLATFGGPLPAWLRDSGASLVAEVLVPAAAWRAELDAALAGLGATASLQAPTLRASGFDLRDLRLDGSLRDGALALRTSDGARLDGGPLALTWTSTLRGDATAPARLQLQWRDGELRGPTTQALRYVVPLFAGLDADTAALQGRLDLNVDVNGPLLPRSDETLLQWLDRWSGTGDVALRSVAFAPAPQLASLLQPVGAAFGPAATLGQNRGGAALLTIDDLRAPFRFAAGAITLQATHWLTQGKRIGLSGSTRLDGTLDFGFDLGDLLRGHRDGDRVLRALGGSLPPATLRGTVSAPSLALPDLQAVLERVLQNEVLEQGTSLLQRELERLLRKKKPQ